ncbi:MAG: ThiF family adenylyltransferase [Corynebacterium amycolatum]
MAEQGVNLSDRDLRRYARHLTLPGFGAEGQRTLRASRVLVIGAGGLGSPALLYLAGAGVGHITIIDDDVVDESNLQRQVIHRESDIGRPKAESAADAVRRLDSEASVTAIVDRLSVDNAEKLFATHDVVLDGADNFATRYLSSDAAELTGTPLVWATILQFAGQLSVFWPGHGPMLRDLYPDIRNKPLGPDADLTSLAKRTAGMSGADLQNVLNEAALLTARVNGNIITADALEEAVDRVIGGPRRTSKVISEQEKKVTAYHEGGHTLAAWALKDIERVYKVTILARGRTGGHALTVPEDDKGMYNLPELFARLVFAMGGRAAEELVFGLPTTGASADIEQATKIARAMVTEYGMSPELGPVKYGEEQGDPFVGRGGSGTLDYSPDVAAKIDQQVRLLINKAHDEAYAILKENRDTLDVLAEKLLEKETLRRPDLEVIFTDVVPRERLNFFDSDTKHPADGREPVKTPVELAIERGEEPPKRVNIFAPVRRREPENQDAGNNGNGQGPAGSTGAGNAGAPGLPGTQQDRPNVPVYGGTPPPAGWTAPGWPPKDTGSAHGSAPAPAPAQAPRPQGQSQPGSQSPQGSPRGQHPGTANYPAGAPNSGSKATGAASSGSDGGNNSGAGNSGGNGPANIPAPPKMPWGRHSGRHRQDNSGSDTTPTTVMPSAGQQQELRGFRLPDNEQPEYPERSANAKSADNSDDKGAQKHDSEKDGVVKRNEDNSAWQDKPDTNEER